jgi:ABC-type transport system involved in multi-copper enzyme maturation permease subunit
MAMTETRVTEVAAAPPSEYSSTGKARVRVIALNTFRESIRDRVLYNLILFVLILVGASVFVSDLSVNIETEFTAALGLSAMLVFGAFIAIFIGIGLVYKEIDKRTIYNLLSKPVHRYEFILGKYLGLCVTLLVNSVVMLLATELAILYVNGGFVRLQVAVLAAAYLVYLELSLLIAVALMFSSFSTPLLSALFSFAVYIIGNFSRDLLQMAAISDSVVAQAVLKVIYYLVPHLSNFSFITEASHGKIVPAGMALSATVYAIVYIGILLSAAMLIFQKRNFK